MCTPGRRPPLQLWVSYPGHPRLRTAFGALARKTTFAPELLVAVIVTAIANNFVYGR